MSRLFLITIITVLGSLSYAQGIPPLSNNQSVESQILSAIAFLEENNNKIAELDRFMATVVDDHTAQVETTFVDMKSKQWDAILMARLVKNALHTISNGMYSRSGIIADLAARFHPKMQSYIVQRLEEIESAIYQSQRLLTGMSARAGFDSNVFFYKDIIDRLLSRLSKKAISPKQPVHYQQIFRISLEIRHLATKFLGLLSVSLNDSVNACGGLF